MENPANTCFFKNAYLFLILISAITVFLLTSAAFGENDSSKSEYLFLGNDILPPMIYIKNGKPIGVIVDLAETIKTRMSHPVSLKYMNWSQAQKLVLDGKADALLHINPSEERKKIFDFSESLLESEFSIFISSDREGVYDIKSLRGLRVGVEEKGLPILIVKRDPLIEIVVVRNIVSGFHLLADGELDAVVVDRWVGSFVVAENNLKKIRIAGEAIEKNNSAIAVRKGNTKLLADINKALSEIKEDGTYKKVLAKWEPQEIVFQTKEEIDRQKILLLSILCVLFVVIISGVFLLLEIKKRRQSERLLLQSENKLQAIIDATPFPVAVVDLQDDTIFYWSRSAQKLFGHTALTTPEWYQIAYPDPDYRNDMIERWKPFLKIASESSQPVNTGEYRVTCKDGTERICELYATFIPNNLIVTFNDITERRQAEDKVAASLDEKEILLKEIHHRVKNNLQIISSLLKLQANSIKDEQVKERFRESQQRIVALGSVHSQLYKSQNFAAINFADYVQDMTRQLLQAYRTGTAAIGLVINIEEIMLPIDSAIPCGLLINEFITNALKYAFPESRQGEITIEAQQTENGVRLIFADNGIGLPNDVDFHTTETLGLRLVQMLVEQLDGSIELSLEKGTRYVIQFKPDKINFIIR